MKNITWGWAALAIVSCHMSACTVETLDSEGASPDIQSTPHAVVGANPKVDAEFMAELVPPPGVSYTDNDVAVFENYIFIRRSDGNIEVRVAGAPHEIAWTYSEYHDRITHGMLAEIRLGLLSTRDHERKIYRHWYHPPEVLGSYPAGVNSIEGITAYGTLIWIYYTPSPGAAPVYRRGQANLDHGYITWQAATQSYPADGLGLVVGPNGGALYSFSNADISNPARMHRQLWSLYQPWVGEALHPKTEHAYLHPEGALDRLSGRFGYDALNDVFYVLDKYSNLGRDAWVLVKIARSKIQF